jgi:DNA-binding PadR family transcriptional regulator
MSSHVRPSPLGLALLGLLQVGPLHPYGIQRLMRLWAKDEVVNVGPRANLYRTINQLHAAGLIAVLQTERNQRFPERTVYELTDQGRETEKQWLTTMLATPRNEFPEFPAALSFAMLLTPEETIDVLVQRAGQLREHLAKLDGTVQESSDTVPRVAVLETEYLRAVTAAELQWVSEVIADLRSGALNWNEEMAQMAGAHISQAGITAGDLGAG